MNKIKVTTILLLFLIVVTLNVFAIKPTSVVQVSSGEGLQIEYPKVEFFVQGEPITLYFHVFNSTNHIVRNDTGFCYMHIYNNTGKHILKTNLDFDSNTKDFKVNLNNSFTTKKGEHSYIVMCNDTISKENGFISTTYYVDNNIPSFGENNTIFMLILLPMIFGLFMLIGAATMGERHSVLKIFLFLLSFVSFWAASHFAIISINSFYAASELSELIATTTSWVGRIFFVVVSYFVIYLIYLMFKSAAESKNKKNEEIEY